MFGFSLEMNSTRSCGSQSLGLQIKPVGREMQDVHILQGPHHPLAGLIAKKDICIPTVRVRCFGERLGLPLGAGQRREANFSKRRNLCGAQCEPV